ncbi:MAG: IS701 family transposase [Actinomycetota bacterium]|nr:IS701 family transposase [Actinomycetota bacterium]
MMTAVMVAGSQEQVDRAAAVRERLEAFGAEMLAGAVNRPVQVGNGGLYLRGLIEQGPRKSLEPMCERLGEEADYQSLQQFIAVSPWDPAVVMRNVAERVLPAIGVQAWVLDDTGFVKDGKHSPGVKRQYSGTLGKIGNCQLGVSLHAVGARGTLPLGWALYLPEEWCADTERRRKAKIPDDVVFKTKPQLGVDLVERAVCWGLAAAPVLGDEAYGDNTALRERLHDAGREYVLAVGAETAVYAPETTFAVPPRTANRGRPPSKPRADREPEAIKALIARLGQQAAQTVSFRDGPDGRPMTSQFIFVRVRAAHHVPGRQGPPREEWLIAEWPKGAEQPLDYWISNLPIDTPPERLARLARLRWKIELDYKQLKGELGLDHYEGRSWLGWHHHTAMVSAAHGFLTLERLRPNHPRPA